MTFRKIPDYQLGTGCFHCKRKINDAILVTCSVCHYTVCFPCSVRHSHRGKIIEWNNGRRY